MTHPCQIKPCKTHRCVVIKKRFIIEGCIKTTGLLATDCNTLHHTSLYVCSALETSTTVRNTLQHAATHCNTLQYYTTLMFARTLTHPHHFTTRCNTLQHPATHHEYSRCPRHTRTILQHAATRCNTLQHAATHHMFAVPLTHPHHFVKHLQVGVEVPGGRTMVLGLLPVGKETGVQHISVHR